MRQIIAFSFIALNALLLLPLPTQAQRTQSSERTPDYNNLSGVWIWSGRSVTGSNKGCTLSSNASYSVDGKQTGDTFEYTTTITQQGNQITIPDILVSNAGGNHTNSFKGEISGNRVTIWQTGGGFKIRNTGTLSVDGNTIEGQTFCRYTGGSATSTAPFKLIRQR